MTDGAGLSIGAANLRAVHVGRSAVSRSAVVTRYPHRPTEVGVPGENPNLAERGLIIADFVERVGDPVPIVAADGSSHYAAAVAADALRALLRALLGGASGTEPVGVAYPAFWRPAAVDALRAAITAMPDFRSPVPAVLVSDATAALVALQRERGLPSRGVVAVCDFGATGTSITLADAAAGFAPLAATQRVEELSGDVIDQALLTRVIANLSTAGSIDLSGTAALGSLTRLRSRCRAAKEGLSTTPVAALTVESLGPHGEVRITRNELDEVIRAPLAGFVAELSDMLRRNDVRQTDLVAVASVGGGARIPIITTTLSEHLRVPVVTAQRPELAPAIGAGLRAVRATVVEEATSMAPAASAAPATRAAAVLPDDAPPSAAFGALAWSAADDAPEVVAAFESGGDGPEFHDGPRYRDGPDYPPPADPDAARPRLAFDPTADEDPVAAETPWYRRRAALPAAGIVVAFVAIAAVVLFAFRGDPAPAPATSPSTVITTSADSPPADAPPDASAGAAQPPAEPPATAPAVEPPRRTVTRRPAPPSTVTVTTEPPAAPPSSTQPPPSSEPPPVSTIAPSTVPPSPPSTQAPPSSQNPFNLPYSTLPGLPFVPAPPGITNP